MHTVMANTRVKHISVQGGVRAIVSKTHTTPTNLGNQIKNTVHGIAMTPKYQKTFDKTHQIRRENEPNPPTLDKASPKDMLREDNISVSEHSLSKYNGIYTIQTSEINGKPWYKNNSGCMLYFYNANSGGGPHGVWMTVLKTERMIGWWVAGSNHRIQAVHL